MHWRTLDGHAPRVIAHRGASGLRPEHTLAAYALALEQGADIIEPDLVPSADGVLFARHDRGLARSTDVAQRGEFAARGEAEDWPVDRLDAGEIDTLRAIQRVRGRSPEFDGCWPPPRWLAVIDWAGQVSRARGESLLLYPELKHPAFFRARGVDPVRLFAESIASPRAGVEIWVQCFDAGALQRVQEATGLRCSLGVDVDDDWRALLRTPPAFVSGLIAAKQLLRDEHGRDSGLVDAAHAAGLRVDAWTFRDDKLDAGYADAEAELAWAMELGVDGLFCDYPATGHAARATLLAAGYPSRPDAE